MSQLSTATSMEAKKLDISITNTSMANSIVHQTTRHQFIYIHAIVPRLNNHHNTTRHEF